MKKIKKYLLFVFLIFASCCCLASCSCSRGGGKDGGDGNTPGDSTPPVNTTYYEVDVDISGVGDYSSSTGSNIHLKGTSPVYTFTPSSSYGIKKLW